MSELLKITFGRSYLLVIAIIICSGSINLVHVSESLVIYSYIVILFLLLVLENYLVKPSILLTVISSNHDETRNTGNYKSCFINILPFLVSNSRQFCWTGIYKLWQLCPSNDVRSIIIVFAFLKINIHIEYILNFIIFKHMCTSCLQRRIYKFINISFYHADAIQNGTMLH